MVITQGILCTGLFKDTCNFKGAQSQRFLCVLAKTAQLFDKVDFFLTSNCS